MVPPAPDTRRGSNATRIKDVVAVLEKTPELVRLGQETGCFLPSIPRHLSGVRVTCVPWKHIQVLVITSPIPAYISGYFYAINGFQKTVYEVFPQLCTPIVWVDE